MANKSKHASYNEIKEEVCKMCERIYKPFDGDYIHIDDKGYDEVVKTLAYAKDEIDNLKDIDMSKYIFIAEANGKTFIKK